MCSVFLSLGLAMAGSAQAASLGPQPTKEFFTGLAFSGTCYMTEARPDASPECDEGVAETYEAFSGRAFSQDCRLDWSAFWKAFHAIYESPRGETLMNDMPDHVVILATLREARLCKTLDRPAEEARR